MKHHFCSRYPVDILRLKESIDPIDFYMQEGQEISARGRGHWKLGGLCPFHADESAGSFYINSMSGAFRCFSCDANGGDIISFVQKRDKLTFQETIKKLIKDWGVT